MTQVQAPPVNSNPNTNGSNPLTNGSIPQGGASATDKTGIHIAVIGRLGNVHEQGVQLKKLGVLAHGGQFDPGGVKLPGLNPSILNRPVKPLKMFDGVPGGGH